MVKIILDLLAYLGQVEAWGSCTTRDKVKPLLWSLKSLCYIQRAQQLPMQAIKTIEFFRAICVAIIIAGTVGSVINWALCKRMKSIIARTKVTLNFIDSHQPLTGFPCQKKDIKKKERRKKLIDATRLGNFHFKCIIKICICYGGTCHIFTTHLHDSLLFSHSSFLLYLSMSCTILRLWYKSLIIMIQKQRRFLPLIHWTRIILEQREIQRYITFKVENSWECTFGSIQTLQFREEKNK